MTRRPSLGRVRKHLWATGQRNCCYCDAEMVYGGGGSNMMTVDHKKPLSRGGKNVRRNYVAACLRCNNAKANMTEAEFRQAMEVGVAFEPGRKEALKKAAFAQQMDQARAMREAMARAFFDRFFYSRSPLNWFLDFRAKIKPRSVVQLNAEKLTVCGQMVFSAERPR